jgi:hypothetical protein
MNTNTILVIAGAGLALYLLVLKPQQDAAAAAAAQQAALTAQPSALSTGIQSTVSGIGGIVASFF